MEFSPEIINRLKKRDEQAFSELYTFMVDRLYRFVAGRYQIPRAEIMDLIGDFFVKLRERIDRINAEGSAESRIWTIFRNFLADRFKTKRNDRRLDVYDEILGDDNENPLRQVHNKTQVERIYAQLNKLDELSQEIILLKFVEDLTYEQIGKVLNIQSDAVRKRASRAIKQIQGNV